MLIELGLKGRIELEKSGLRRRSLANRRLYYKNDGPTGDVLLDEALKHIKDGKDEPVTVQNWIELLSGKLVIVAGKVFETRTNVVRGIACGA